MSDPKHPNDEAQWRDGINRENFAIRRQLRDLTKDERGLEQRLDASAASQRDAKKTIESHSRAEHWGASPSVRGHGEPTRRIPSRTGTCPRFPLRLRAPAC